MKNLLKILPAFLLFVNIANAQDTIPPKIELIGETAVALCQCDTNLEGKFIFNDKGYIITDNLDSVQHLKVDTTGSLHDLKYSTSLLEGMFTIKYLATDRAGNKSNAVTRVVIIKSYYEFPCYNKPNKCTPVNINETQKNQIKIYPNPAANQIQINSTSPIKRIYIYNVSGKCFSITHQITQTNSITINTKHFPTGLYMVKAETDNGYFISKLLISP